MSAACNCCLAVCIFTMVRSKDCKFFVNSSQFEFWKLWPTSGMSKQIFSKMRRSLYKNEDLLAVQCKSTSWIEAEKTNPKYRNECCRFELFKLFLAI